MKNRFKRILGYTKKKKGKKKEKRKLCDIGYLTQGFHPARYLVKVRKWMHWRRLGVFVIMWHDNQGGNEEKKKTKPQWIKN